MAEPMPVPVETDNRRARLWVNWAAALLTAAGAALVPALRLGRDVLILPRIAGSKAFCNA